MDTAWMRRSVKSRPPVELVKLASCLGSAARGAVESWAIWRRVCSVGKAGWVRRLPGLPSGDGGVEDFCFSRPATVSKVGPVGHGTPLSQRISEKRGFGANRYLTSKQWGPGHTRGSSGAGWAIFMRHWCRWAPPQTWLRFYGSILQTGEEREPSRAWGHRMLVLLNLCSDS